MFGWYALAARTRYQTAKPVERKRGGKDKINDVVVFASIDYRNLLAYLLMRCGGCYCSMGFQVRQVALRFAGLCSTFAGPFPRKECRDT